MFNVQWNPVTVRAANGLGTVTVVITNTNGANGNALQGIQSINQFPHSFRTLLRQVLTGARQRLGITDTSRVGAVIEARDAAGNRYDIGVRTVPWPEFNVNYILETIMKAMESSQSIELSMTIRIDVIHRVGGPATVGAGGNNFILTRLAKSKRSMVEIHPENDPYKSEEECLYQWIVLGISNLFREPHPHQYCRPALEYMDWFENELGITSNTWNLLTSGRPRFEHRHELANRLRAYVPEAIQAQGPWKVLTYLENCLPIHFVVYNVHNRMQVCFPEREELPREESGNEIFGIMEVSDGKGHVNLLTKPTCLLDGDYPKYCPCCYEVFAHSRVCTLEGCKESERTRCPRSHTCIGYCEACKTVDCGKFNPSQEQEIDEDLLPHRQHVMCRYCSFSMYSPRCSELHQQVCVSMRGMKCAKCGLAEHRGLKCHEKRCLMCSEKLKSDQEHVCYLKRTKLKKDHGKYWTYDFEACVDENGKHVIYLATAWPMYPLPTNEAMRRYESRDVEGYPFQPVFIFWGIEGVKELFTFFHEPWCNRTTWFAHNAGKYDSIFVEKYMLEMHGQIPSKLQRGTRIMQMEFSANEVTFKDSLCFIPSALRAMPSSFGITELAKGFFPHKLMTVSYFEEAETQHFRVRRPPREVWETDFRRGKDGLKEKKEMEEFLTRFYSTDDLWDLKEDSIRYCISDTVLLGNVLRVFSQECRNANPEWNVFANVTLPSAAMNLYMSTALPEKTLTVVERYDALQRQNTVKWALWRMRNTPERYARYLNQLEFYEEELLKLRWRSDDTIEVYCFISCYDWGCIKCYPAQARNLRKDVPFFERYGKLKKEMALMEYHARLEGWELQTIWEHEWNKVVKTKEYKDWYSTYEDLLTDWIPLDPRDAYKGGVSEIYKIYHPQPFCMSDFVSQYPTSMLGFSFDPRDNCRRTWDMPCGTVERTVHPSARQIEETNKLGIVKCRVIPPPRLYVPFLGYRAPSMLVKNSYEVLYGLCRVCMEERMDGPCNHSDQQRSFTGTWTIAEVQYAVSIGYRLFDIGVEMWEYSDRNNTLFKEFIVPFIVNKIMAKKEGLVEGDSFTPEGQQVADYIEALTRRRPQPQEFVDSPVKRTTSKLIINALYGKFGQRSVWPSSRAFTESEADIKACDELLWNENVEIQSFELIPRVTVDGADEVVAIISYEQNYAASRGEAKKHDMIAAHITAYGRIMLNETAQLLGTNMMGCDTDSLAHSLMDPLPYHTGFRIGDLELELPEAKEWVANGRKSYMYRKLDGSTVCKQKGVSLKISMENVFTLENMLAMIQATREMLETIQEEQGVSRREALEILHQLEEDRPSLDVPQLQFITKRGPLQGEKITQENIKKTRFLLEACKRRIIPLEDRIDTLPFGWVE